MTSITTRAASAVDSDSAKSGGVITHSGTKPVTAHGVCWNKTGSPTIADPHTGSVGSVLELALSSEAKSAVAAAGAKAGVLELALSSEAKSAVAAAGAKAGTGGTITLSVSHADIGDEVTITAGAGVHFGATRGTNKVWFGEAKNPCGFRVCTKEAASYVSWSDTSITVTVPSMSPGKTGYPHTYHKVRVEVSGVETDPADFFIDPVSTVSNHDYVATNTDGNEIPNTANVLYDTCTYTDTNTALKSSGGGVAILNGFGGTFQNITFLNCTFNSNNHANQTDDPFFTGTNGMKVFGSGGNVHDITWADCTFGNYRRMGIEMCDQGNGALVFRNLGIRGCTFGLTGWEPISFSTWAEPANSNIGREVYSLVEDCIIHNGYDHGGCIESNGSPMLEIRDTSIWGGSSPVFNWERLTQNNSSSAGNANMYVSGVSIDFSLGTASVGGTSMMSSIGANGPNGSIWDDCRFYCGTAARHCGTGLNGDGNNNNFRGRTGHTSYIWGTISYGSLFDWNGSGNTGPTQSAPPA